MRYSENEIYFTAESTITWPLDPTTTPHFFIIAVSWNETFDQPDYRAFRTTRASDLYRTTEQYALCRFPDAQGLSQAQPARLARTVSLSSRQALFERKHFASAAGPVVVAAEKRKAGEEGRGT